MSIQLNELKLSYGDNAILKGLTHRFPPNSISCILGKNGCGKSTLLKTISKFLYPSYGNVLLSGQDINTMNSKQIALKLGFLTQSSDDHKGLTVYQLVKRGRYPHNGLLQVESTNDEKIINEALALTELNDISHKDLDEISGGQKQRAWIAMILAQDTDILLLDEPTTFLDIHHRQEIIKLINKLKNDYNKTIVAVVHDLYESQKISDYIIGIKDGIILQEGLSKDILNKKFIENLYDVKCDEYKFNNESYFLPSKEYNVNEVYTNNDHTYLVSNLYISYGDYPVLKDLDLTLKRRKIHCIMGINGSGKSTLIKAIVGEQKLNSGTINLYNKDISSYKVKELSKKISYLSQEETLPSGFTVEEYVNLGRFPYTKWYKQWTRKDREIVYESLKAVGAEDLMKCNLLNLSGGQQQRVRIARLLAQKSEVLVLDEPCSFLDIKGQKEVLDCIEKIAKNENKTIIMILHDPWQAALYGQELHIIKDMQVIFSGNQTDFINPVNLQELYNVDWVEAKGIKRSVLFPNW